MPFCPKCGRENPPGIAFCPSCGYNLGPPPQPSGIIIVTSPTIPGYKIVKVVGIVHGMTARTRGIGGKLIAGLQSLAGGEVSAFTSELEKAKREATTRLEENAKALGANAVLNVDFETTEVFESVVMISAYGTAVIAEKESS